MNIKVTISINIKEGAIKLFKEFFLRHNKKDIAKKITQYPMFNVFTLDFKDPLLQKARRELKKFTESWKEIVTFEFSEEELKSCKLLQFIWLRYPKAYAGPMTETEYNLSNACSECGTGAIQIGSLLIRPSDIKNLDIQNTCYNHVIISKKLFEAFKKAGVRGAEFRQIASKVNKKKLNFYQIIPKITLPPLMKSSNLNIENQCPICKRDGYFDGHVEGEPKILGYKLSDKISEKADFFFTYETFGISRLREPFRESVFNQPKILVKPIVLDILSKMKVREAGFFPIIVNSQPNIEKWREDFMKRGR